ncbi:hypothetical protein [[Limnothrix rosea] IAM M-220]|nr:hypothetical protein [[Limnothrix rosea] IAM M-220]
MGFDSIFHGDRRSLANPNQIILDLFLNKNYSSLWKVANFRLLSNH